MRKMRRCTRISMINRRSVLSMLLIWPQNRTQANIREVRTHVLDTGQIFRALGDAN